MWGLFVGIAIGVLQVLALSKLSKMMLGGDAPAKLIGSLLLFIKIAAIVFILYLVSTVSIQHLLWTAGGMLLGLIAVSAYILIWRKKTDGKGGSDA